MKTHRAKIVAQFIQWPSTSHEILSGTNSKDNRLVTSRAKLIKTLETFILLELQLIVVIN